MSEGQPLPVNFPRTAWLTSHMYPRVQAKVTKEPMKIERGASRVEHSLQGVNDDALCDFANDGDLWLLDSLLVLRLSERRCDLEADLESRGECDSERVCMVLRVLLLVLLLVLVSLPLLELLLDLLLLRLLLRLRLTVSVLRRGRESDSL